MSAVASSTHAVEINNLYKSYGGIKAVDGLSLKIETGELFGLIGADGAGKTTIFNILAGILTPTNGAVEVLGDVPARSRFRLGYLTQQFSLNLELSVRENIRYVGGLRKVEEETIDTLAAKYLELMGMSRFVDRLAGALSGGMKQKLALCASLVSRPKLLLLDEPTTGVDPVSRREFWDILAQIRGEGVTIAVATPYMDEAERCTRVALLDAGQIVETGPPEDLCASLKIDRIIVRTNNIVRLMPLLDQKKPLVYEDVQLFGDHADVLCRESQSAMQSVAQQAQSIGITDLALSKASPSLANVFEFKQGQRAERQSGYVNFEFKEEERPGGTTAIDARNLQKTYGSFHAVKGVDIEVKFGQIYGLLGANGAGKTTCIKMLCGLISASGGQISLAGRDTNLRDKSMRRLMGYMSQKFTLYEDLSLIENLRFYCGVYNVPLKLRPERIDWVLEIAGLKGYENLLTRDLPGGWKQRLSLGAAVLHQPSILFLDEPTSGVDPVARRQMWRLITDFASHNTAVLVTTHFLEEAEYCHKLGLMVDGEMAATGSPVEIKRSQPGVLVQLFADQTQVLYGLLRQKFEPWKVSIFGACLHVLLDDPQNGTRIVDSTAAEHGIKIISRSEIPFTLEDAFIGIVMRKQQRTA